MTARHILRAVFGLGCAMTAGSSWLTFKYGSHPADALTYFGVLLAVSAWRELKVVDLREQLADAEAKFSALAKLGPGVLVGQNNVEYVHMAANDTLYLSVDAGAFVVQAMIRTSDTTMLTVIT